VLFGPHWVVVGEQATHVPLRQTGVGPAQVAPFAQLPVLSQVWMVLVPM
jgi:hypothetical protein